MTQQQQPPVHKQPVQVPAAPSKPVPIDPSLLRQVSGGTEESPGRTW
jgi:hypothetical protein